MQMKEYMGAFPTTLLAPWLPFSFPAYFPVSVSTYKQKQCPALRP